MVVVERGNIKIDKSNYIFYNKRRLFAICHILIISIKFQLFSKCYIPTGMR